LTALLFLCAGWALLAYVFTGVAASFGVMTDPVSERSNHIVPTSRAGGFVLLFLMTVLASILALADAPAPPGIAVAAFIAGVIGLLDDARPLSASLKFVLLLLVSALTVRLAGPLPALPIIGAEALPPLLHTLLATMFVFVFVNAFNFMDGLNGMSGGVGMVGLGVLVVAGAGAGMDLLLLLVAAAAAIYGFTIRNVLTGGIFLGDAGSLSIGTLLAGGALYVGQYDNGGFYAFVIAMVPYLADVAATLARRWNRGDRLFEPHKEHFYQRLRTRGYSHEAVALTYTLLSALGGVLGLWAGAQYGNTGLWASGVSMVLVFIATLAVMFRRAGAASDPAHG
jgi:UDP-N-acetylmuramyl pentapeptide phosphotransferase/UDP-N-acetylglucosamine-1-phosphate transferase